MIDGSRNDNIFARQGELLLKAAQARKQGCYRMLMDLTTQLLNAKNDLKRIEGRRDNLMQGAYRAMNLDCRGELKLHELRETVVFSSVCMGNSNAALVEESVVNEKLLDIGAKIRLVKEELSVVEDRLDMLNKNICSAKKYSIAMREGTEMIDTEELATRQFNVNTVS